MKILFFANTGWYLYNFRLPLLKALKQRGDELVLISPPDQYINKLQSAGFRWLPLPFARGGINPFRDAVALVQLIALYSRERPDLVHHFTVKCVIYGTFAARILGIKGIVNAITGLGSVFSDGSVVRRWVQELVRILYKLALPGTVVIFQNEDDKGLFIKRGIVDPGHTRVIRGSGVDLNQFTPKQESDSVPLIILPARLLWNKGVGEFVQAARLLKPETSARFALVGELGEDNPAGIGGEQVESWIGENIIEWWGWIEDMASVYKQAHIVCLPSYREGIPRTLIEAAASGRAIVTTDVPGCREVVRHEINGLLVPAKDFRALADSLAYLIANPQVRKKMGLAGRMIVQEHFSTDRIVRETVEIYQDLVSQ